jgi:uncharacterized membrane protein
MRVTSRVYKLQGIAKEFILGHKMRSFLIQGPLKIIYITIVIITISQIIISLHVIIGIITKE